MSWGLLPPKPHKNAILTLLQIWLMLSYCGAASALTLTSDEKAILMIILHTTKGDIQLELDFEKAPKTAANFEAYVRAGHYDGTIFHRVIDNFMIQGGGFTAEMQQKPTQAPIENEANNGLSNKTGTIAMARTMDPHSASAQFFINIADNTFLDHTSKTMQGWGYCVFGRVVAGMEVVNQIKGVTTGNAHGHQDVPTEAIVITSAEVIEAQD